MTEDEKIKLRTIIQKMEESMDEGKSGKCCFCNAVFDGMGNSTWPIYYRKEGETYRCCDRCNDEYVVAARTDRTLIMGFREKFGIRYEV